METKKNIVVVDDNEDIVAIVKMILDGKGYDTDGAKSGRELFHLLEDKKPDLIILDIMMPQKNGLEVLAQLRHSPTTAKIPVILLTAKRGYNDIVDGYKVGADYYITKPFSSSQLINGIKFVLHERRIEQGEG